MKSLGRRNTTNYRQPRRQFQEADTEALQRAQVLVQSNNRITVATVSGSAGFLEGTGATILLVAAGAFDDHPEGPGPERARRPRPTATHRLARGARRGGEEAARHADRSGARAPHRPGNPWKRLVLELDKIYF